MGKKLVKESELKVAQLIWLIPIQNLISFTLTSAYMEERTLFPLIMHLFTSACIVQTFLTTWYMEGPVVGT